MEGARARPKISLIFILDTLLALLPTLDIVKHHGEGWFVYVLYWFILGVLRGADKWTVENNYAIWWRAAVKIVVLGIIEGLVLVSAVTIRH